MKQLIQTRAVTTAAKAAGISFHRAYRQKKAVKLYASYGSDAAIADFVEAMQAQGCEVSLRKRRFRADSLYVS